MEYQVLHAFGYSTGSCGSDRFVTGRLHLSGFRHCRPNRFEDYDRERRRWRRCGLSNGQKATTSNFEVETLENFSSDKRTRLSIFATGISANALNTNTSNDINVGGNVRVNYAESIAVEARLSNGQTFMLPVEFAGVQGVLPGLDQVNVILISQLKGAGTVKLTLIVGGQRSNAPTVFIK